MAVICRDCSHVNEEDNIMQIVQDGRRVRITVNYTPRYCCVECHGTDIVSAD